MIVFRSPRWLMIFLAIVCVASSVGFALLLQRYGLALRTMGVGAFALFSAAGLVDALLTRVELKEDALIVVSNLRKRTIPRAEIASVTWASGVGVALVLMDSRVVKLPDVGNSQSRANSIRAWLAQAHSVLAIVLIGLWGLLGSATLYAEVPRGIAITPRNFPSHTAADVDQAFVLAKEVGQHAVFIYQWSEVESAPAAMMVTKAGELGLAPVLALSPTALGGGRKELDVPASVRRKAGENLSFSNPIVRRSFVKAATDLARLKPPYLCLATEINLLAMQRLPEFLHFVVAYKEAYRAVKRVSPETKVFVTFQWEWMRILDAKEPDRVAEHSKVIDIFRPELDVVGFTSYPSPFHDTPNDLGPRYYTEMFRHISADDPVMLMEIGWPTSGSGSETEQLAFVERLPSLLKGINLVGVAWALLHDVRIGAFNDDLNSVGLRYRDGRAKAGYGRFRALTLPTSK